MSRANRAILRHAMNGTDFVMPTPASYTDNTRVLIADDDSASCRFLGDGLRSLGLHVCICADGTVALRLARTEAFDLLLLDCHMPGAGALPILKALRDDSDAKSHRCVAVATTAELDPADRQELLNCGFSAILYKPCSLSELQRTLSMLPLARLDVSALDDAQAMTASGSTTTMSALRHLLHHELSILLGELDLLSRDATALSERLHRLRSSCGFCGATALSGHAARLQQELSARNEDTSRPVESISIAKFQQALLATLHALGH